MSTRAGAIHLKTHHAYKMGRCDLIRMDGIFVSFPCFMAMCNLFPFWQPWMAFAGSKKAYSLLALTEFTFGKRWDGISEIDRRSVYSLHSRHVDRMEKIKEGEKQPDLLKMGQDYPT